MTDIPADIRALAREALEKCDIYSVGEGGGSEIYEHLVEDAIAEAILAERERCAKMTPEMIKAGAESIMSLDDTVSSITAQGLAEDCYRAMVAASNPSS